MSHSPEPWGLHDRGHESPTICREIDEDTCHEIAVLTGCQGMSHEERIANGERIVACVNACRGIPTEDLVSGRTAPVRMADIKVMLEPVPADSVAPFQFHEINMQTGQWKVTELKDPE